MDRPLKLELLSMIVQSRWCGDLIRLFRIKVWTEQAERKCFPRHSHHLGTQQEGDCQENSKKT